MTNYMRNWRNHLLWIGPALVGTGTFLYQSNLSLARFVLPFREATLWGEGCGAIACLIAFVLAVRRNTPSWKKVLPALFLLVALGMAARIYDREYTAYREELVQFTNEGATLRGTLFLPKTIGPHPAIVIVHGSGDFKRRLYRIWADHIVRVGIAVLLYDKRGVGDSTGQYEGNNNTSRKNLELLAGDVVSGVGYLTGRADIRKDQIGLLGISQGGWIVPLAAEQSRHVGFMVLLSGPTVTVGEQNDYADLAGGNDGNTNKTESLSWEDLEQRSEHQPPSGFDPMPYLERSNTPGLWLFGGRDRLVPVMKSVRRLDDLIRKEQKPFQYFVFPYANHLLLVTEGPQRRLIPDFPPGYWQKLLGWMLDRVNSYRT
jgi:dienelactone hydrolase